MNRSIEALPEYATKMAVYAVGLGMALFLGLAAGTGNFQQITKVLLVMMGLVYVLFFQSTTWKIIYFICTFSLGFTPAGFYFGGYEITVALLVCLFCASWWRKEMPGRPIEVESPHFKMFNLSLIMWIGYNILHMLYNIYDPYWAGDIAIKNLLKTYMQWIGLPIVVFYFMNRPQALVVKADFPRTIGRIVFIGLAFNLAIRMYAFSKGAYGVDNTLTSQEVVQSMFTIPLIGARENPYALRCLGPVGVLIGMVFLHSDWIKSQRKNQVLIYFLIMCMGILGSFLSGGRITIATAALFAMVVLVIQKRYDRLILSTLICLFLLIATNFLYHTGAMAKLPPMVMRSSAALIVGKSQDAKEALHGSNDWRDALFEMSLAEWKSDSRIFWFGRSTYSYGYADDVDAKLRGGEGVLISSLRRGSTHNLLTDILVVYGLVGLGLYLFLTVAFLVLVWNIYRGDSRINPNVEPAVRSLALFVFINTGVWIAYGLYAGSSGMFDGLALLLIISRIHTVYREKTSAPATNKERPAMLGGNYSGLPELSGRTSGIQRTYAE